MIDGSKLSYKENVELVKEVVLYAKNNDVSVEAEIGNIVSDENTIIETNSVISIKDASKSTKLEEQLLYYKLKDVNVIKILYK